MIQNDCLAPFEVQFPELTTIPADDGFPMAADHEA
jgi:hypothetical protein